MNEIADNLERVRSQIADAAKKSGRSPEDVELVAISKTHEAEKVRAALEAGQQLVHRTSAGRAQWLYVIAGEISVAGETLKVGDGAALENFQSVEIKGDADAQFLLFDLR